MSSFVYHDNHKLYLITIMNLCDTIIMISILLHITTADTPLILLYYYYNIIIFVINFNILLYNSLVIVQ